jgi:hypothetical protein
VIQNDSYQIYLPGGRMQWGMEETERQSVYARCFKGDILTYIYYNHSHLYPIGQNFVTRYKYLQRRLGNIVFIWGGQNIGASIFCDPVGRQAQSWNNEEALPQTLPTLL